jgi:hypothetical protein
VVGADDSPLAAWPRTKPMQWPRPQHRAY